ncbi:MAG TPA: HipA domain-containing protein [Thermoanaerobaculia bacterium]|nr:HipA domain-containing protein [Thermoanaerobaculia bacterium]
MTRLLEVSLHGVPVGELEELEEGGSEFRFREQYFDLVPRPVLGQKFEDDLLKEAHPSRRSENLPDFFANLVPEGRLRELIEQTSGVGRGDDFGLLAFVGGDLPGAVTVRPIESERVDPGVPRLVAPPAETQAPASEPSGVRFSLAGVQLKLSMLREGETLTVPVHDQAGDWIVKFDSPTFPHLPENEFSMLEWARGAGFLVPECHLHDLTDLDHEVALLGLVKSIVPEGTRVLAIRRYDRTVEDRVHQEDFAQAIGLPPALKYDHVRYETMALLVRRFIGEEGVDEFLRRLILTVAAGNGDAHLKNWSLIYPDRVQAAWSPVYDQVATVSWPELAPELSLKLAGVKLFVRIDGNALDRFAARAQIDRERVSSVVGEALARLRTAWKELRSSLPLVPGHRKAIEEHWRRVPLLREAGGLD